LASKEEQARINRIIEILETTYPKSQSTLQARTPLEILVATILSAQSTDTQVNLVTSKLFQKYSNAKDFATANLSQLQKDIFAVGFYRQKARFIKYACQMIIKEFNGKVPHTMEALLQLHGVGRKTANIVLNRAFNVVVGIAVDTHVFRIAHRLGLSKGHNPIQVERDLMKKIPEEFWGHINGLFITHGRHLCDARNPQCEICPLNSLCPYAIKNGDI
jgi:endonuclease-3